MFITEEFLKMHKNVVKYYYFVLKWKYKRDSNIRL